MNTHANRTYAFMLSLFLALTLLGCASGRPAGERVSDQWIETKVKTALVADPDVGGTSIEVEVRNGQVSLAGFVKSRDAARRAVDIARRVDGVTSVQDKLSVRG